MQSTSRDLMLEEIKSKYPTFSQASAAFSTSLQSVLLTDIEKAYSDKSPTISDLERMYGSGSATLWIKTQLMTLDFASGTKDGADMNVLQEFSALFAAKYYHIKLTEFLLFMARFKLGQYGKFYSYFDVIAVGEAFKRFLLERNEEIDIVIRKRNNRAAEELKTDVERNHQMPDDIRQMLNKK